MKKSWIARRDEDAFLDLITGTQGDDEFHGSDDDDFYQGRDGNDTIFGNRGDDRLVGGSGSDNIQGGQGNDLLTGKRGDDRLFGGSGFDNLYGGQGKDRLFGGDGSDYLEGYDHKDILTGGPGSDVFRFYALPSFSFGSDLDIITDFDTSDPFEYIWFTADPALGITEFSQLRDMMVQDGKDVVLSVGARDLLVFENVRIGQLKEEHFYIDEFGVG